MPIHREGSGWQWGNHGKVYPTRAGAERQAAAAHANGYKGDAKAAGVALRAPGGEVLLMRRSSQATDHPGEWAFPGGHVEPGETVEQSAARELLEETGFGAELLPPMALIEYQDDFATFAIDVPFRMIPTVNEEHDGFAWAHPNALPSPLHPGVAKLLEFDRSRTADHAGYYAPQALGKTRKVTPEGWLILEKTPIARTGEQVYSAHELDGLEADGAGLIIVSRPPEEVFRPETMASFEGKDYVINHPPDGVDVTNWKNHTVGHVHNVCRGEGIEDDLLLADIVVKDPLAIAYVNKHLPENSAGYKADYVQVEPGRAICTNIIGNHVAAVQAGRAGARVAVRDSLPALVPQPMGVLAMAKRTLRAAVRDAFAAIGVKPSQIEEIETKFSTDGLTVDEAMDSKGSKDALMESVENLANDMKAVKDYIKDRQAKDAKEEEEKAERRKAEDAEREKAEAKDAERAKAEDAERKAEETGDTILEAEDPGKTINLGKTWTGGMTGDAAEPVLTGAIARAEILAPGIAKPTAEAIKGNRGTALANFMRTALTQHMSKDAAGAEGVRIFLQGRKVEDLRGHALLGAFNGAAQLARARNNGGARVVVARGQRTGDFGKAVSIDSINQRNREFWANRGTGK